MADNEAFVELNNKVETLNTSFNSFSNNSLKYNSETDYFGMEYNGVWKDIVFAGFKALYLYKDGDECTSIHGSTWMFNSNVSTVNTFDYIGSGGTSSKTKQSNHIKLYVNSTSQQWSFGNASVYLDTPIDLTQYNKLVVRATTSKSGSGTKSPSVNIFTSKPKNIAHSSGGRKTLGELKILTNSETEFDIRNYMGDYYILIDALTYTGDTANSANAGNVSILIYEIRLEK